MHFLVVALLAQITAAAPPPSPATGSAYAGAAGLNVIWAPTLEAARTSARELTDGRILLFFTDSDCGQCERMLKLVAPSTSFWAFTRDKVPVPVDIGKPEGLKLAQRLRVQGVPTWIVVTPDLLECGRQEGVTTQQGWIDAFIQSERGWAGYRRALADEAASPGDSVKVFEVARQTYQRGGREQSESRFRRLASDPKAPADVREQSLAYLASIDLDAGRLDEATARLDTLIASSKSPQLKERAELRRADVELARGRKDLAAYRLREFTKAHPESPLAGEAKALLDALEGRAPAPAALPKEK